MDTTVILQRIRALRALAQSSNIHEAQAAAAKAAALVEQYRIDEAELIVESGVDTEPILIDGEPVDVFPRVIPWKVWLADALAEHNGCTVYTDRRRCVKRLGGVAIPAVERTIRIVGRPSDIAMVRFFYAWLTAEITRLLDKEGRGNGKSWRNSWATGAVVGIRTQLGDANKAVRETATSSAMVLVSSRQELANQHMKANVKTQKTSYSGASDADAFRSGKRHGENMHLGAALPAAHRALPGKGT